MIALLQNSHRRAFLLLSFLAMALTLCSCDSAPVKQPASGIPASGSKKALQIVTTTAMVGDIVAAVAGDRATVSSLMGEGVDPHLFTAGRSDMLKLQSADVVFYSGLKLEGRMSDDFQRITEKGRPAFAVTDVLDKSYLRAPPEFDGHFDPHVWMDVAAWSRCVELVAGKLSEIDPDGAATYQRNAAAYRERLQKLDDYVRQVIATIPTEQRHLVTAHDAFGYFSRAYGIEVRAIQGISTDAQAAVADINALVDFMVKQKVPAIFVESSVPSRNIEAVIEGCASRGWKATKGAELFSDAMGQPGTYEGTYIGMMDHNATCIARALGGTAPEGGWENRLRKPEAKP